MRVIAFAAATAALLSAAAVAQAPAFPTKPVRLLVGSPPGGPSDIASRLIGERFTERSKLAVTVENKPGAANSLASKEVAGAAPDGHTLIVNPDTVVTLNPYIYRNLGFDARADLVPVTVVATFAQMLVCHPSVAVKSVPELIAKSKASAQPLLYASGGAGSPGHLAAAMMVDATQAKMEHVPYKGPSPATQAVLAGEVACGFLAVPTVLQHVKAGKLLALAMSSSQPSPLAPEVPPITQVLGRKDVDATFKLVLMAPKGTPAATIAAIQKETADILRIPEVKQKLAAVDLLAVGGSTAEAAQMLKADGERWSAMVKRVDLKVE